MKHFKLLSFLLLLTLAGSAQDQNPCPFIQASALLKVSQEGSTCKAKVQFTTSSNNTGTNAVSVIVYNGVKTSTFTPTILYQDCITVPSNTVSTTFETTLFNIQCSEPYTYELIKYKSNSCGSGPVECMNTVTGPAGAPLPIKLSSFYGNRKNNSVILDWTSAQESNASYYGIEKNTGAGFNTINKVNATNNSITTKYSFEDQNTSKSAIQYRLRLVDKDGSFTLSNVVSIKGVSSVSNVDIYPNPAVVGNAKIKISDITDITNVQVYDLSGKIIKNINVTNNDINLSDLKAGSYLLKIVNAKTGGAATKRFIILN